MVSRLEYFAAILRAEIGELEHVGRSTKLMFCYTDSVSSHIKKQQLKSLMKCIRILPMASHDTSHPHIPLSHNLGNSHDVHA